MGDTKHKMYISWGLLKILSITCNNDDNNDESINDAIRVKE